MDDKPDLTKYYSELIAKTLKELKRNGLELLESMLQVYKEFSNKILKDLAEGTKKNLEVLESLNGELEKNIFNLIAKINDIKQLDCSNFSNYLEVEAMRREIFLEICAIRISVIKAVPQPRRGRKKDKNFLADAVSSSGDSSGDTKKSYSPSPSFATEDREYFTKITKSNNLKPPEKLPRYEDFYLRKEFQFLQKGNLTLPLGKNNLCVPVEESDLLSIIAYSLNSQEYFDEVLSTMPEKNDVDKIESELLTSNERHFQHQFTTYEQEEFREFAHREDSVHLYGHHITYNVHMFFPRQFQIIRDHAAADHLEFIMGIASAEPKKEQLGKSKATFCKSQNNLYIIKILDEKEFGMFKELAPNYFRHFCNSEFHNMPCKMVKTLGCYRVFTKNLTLGKAKCE